jgi:hypothetical protein
MSESINVNKSAKQVIVLNAISRRIEEDDKITRIMKVNNAEVELFMRVLFFRDRYFSNKRRVFMPKELNSHSSAFNLSGGHKKEAWRFDR